MATLWSLALLVLCCLCSLSRSDATILRWITPELPSATGRSNTTVSVTEDNAPGTVIMRLRAEISGSLVSYGLESSSVPGLFSVDSVSGTVYVNSMLDYESFTMVTVTASARDDLGGTGSVTFNVNVINVNDNVPRFSQRFYNVNLDGNEAQPGTNVVRVSAIDVDDDRVTYALAGGNSNHTFAIDANSGVITLASTQTLHKTDRFALLVTAVDEGVLRHTGTVSVIIRVLHDVTSVVG